MKVEAVTTAEEISDIAFGFMGSKALFAGLHIELFTRLSGARKTIEQLSQETDVPPNRLRVLLNALGTIGLVEENEWGYANAPASESFLVQGARGDFSDYLRYQIDQQMYEKLLHLNDSLTGRFDGSDGKVTYAHWMANPEEAELYSRAQHTGSLGPGSTLARLVDLSDAKTLLDVGGGTGAMTIRLCEANPTLQATIIDFPNVAAIGWGFITEAKLVDRVRYIPGDALKAAWPTGQGAILMSYLLSGVPGEAIAGLLEKAHDSMLPGGQLMIHDFLVRDDGYGPPLAALWQLQHMAFTPGIASLSPRLLIQWLKEAGFIDVEDQEMIPGMTRLVRGRRAE